MSGLYSKDLSPLAYLWREGERRTFSPQERGGGMKRMITIFFWGGGGREDEHQLVWTVGALSQLAHLFPFLLLSSSLCPLIRLWKNIPSPRVSPACCQMHPCTLVMAFVLLIDSVQVMSSYTDVVVIRHPQPGAVQVGATVL